MDLNINDKLDAILHELKELKLRESRLIVEPYQSVNTNEINSAISEATLEFPEIKINRQNPYLASGYSDLHEILTKIRPILGKHNLHITQIKKQMDGRTLLVTRIWHSSGQWIESRVMLTPHKNTIESYGSNLDSYKRFEVMDILSLTVSGDPYDDGGEADMEDDREAVVKGTVLKDLLQKKNESYETISSLQYEELMYELNDHADLVTEIIDGLNIKTIREMPRSRYKPTKDRIMRMIKRRKDGFK